MRARGGHHTHLRCYVSSQTDTAAALVAVLSTVCVVLCVVPQGLLQLTQSLTRVALCPLLWCLSPPLNPPFLPCTGASPRRPLVLTGVCCWTL